MKDKIAVAFICTGNSCRSQMAEGLLRFIAGNKFEVYSAGAKPEGIVASLAIEVMREIGIDISSHFSKTIDSIRDKDFDYVITVCDNARQACPIFHGKDGTAKMIHWSVRDPWGDDSEIYREIRDELKSRIEKFVKETTADD